MTATCLLIEGVGPGEIPPEFLTAVMDAAEDNGLSAEGISILRRDFCEENQP